MRWGGAGVLVATYALGCLAGRAGAQEARATDSPLRVTVREAYYTLHETSLAEVIDTLNAMHLAGPDTPLSQGLTEYQIRPSWRMTSAPERCRISEVVVSADVTITLPEWPAVEARPKREREAWARLDHAIRAHEDRHREIVVQAAHDLHTDLIGIEAPNCSELDRAVRAAVAASEERLREEHVAFDRETPPVLDIGRVSNPESLP